MASHIMVQWSHLWMSTVVSLLGVNSAFICGGGLTHYVKVNSALICGSQQWSHLVCESQQCPHLWRSMVVLLLEVNSALTCGGQQWSYLLCD